VAAEPESTRAVNEPMDAQLFKLIVTRAEARVHAVTLSPVVVFGIKVQYHGERWRIHRRYSQFVALHSELSDLYPDVRLPRLPPKSLGLFTPATARSPAVLKRLALLQTYVSELLLEQTVRESPVVLDWIQLVNEVSRAPHTRPRANSPLSR
jgi:hypothetical protein